MKTNRFQGTASYGAGFDRLSGLAPNDSYSRWFAEASRLASLRSGARN
jgi:hypothetical protein